MGGGGGGGGGRVRRKEGGQGEGRGGRGGGGPLNAHSLNRENGGCEQFVKAQETPRFPDYFSSTV